MDSPGDHFVGGGTCSMTVPDDFFAQIQSLAARDYLDSVAILDIIGQPRLILCANIPAARLETMDDVQ